MPRYMIPVKPPTAMTLPEAVALLLPRPSTLGAYERRAALVSLVEQADLCWRTPREWARVAAEGYNRARSVIFSLAEDFEDLANLPDDIGH